MDASAVKQPITANRIKQYVFKYNAPLILIVLIVVAIILSPVFLSKRNIMNILSQQSTYIIISLGMMLTLMVAGIDLSVSSVTAIGSIMAAMALMDWGFDSGFGLLLMVLVVLAVCAAIGAFNGLLIAKFNIPDFIVTLATMTAGQGLAYLITSGAPIQLDTSSNSASRMLAHFGESSDPVLGVPYPAYFMILIVVIFYLVTKYTRFGRLVIATGSNANAVQLAGINTKKYKFLAYVICSAMCGFAGIIITARSAIGTPQTTSDDYSLSTVAACVIGGCSLGGGKGGVGGTLIGVFVIALIGNIMNLLSVTAYPQLIIKGLIIILAVLLQSMSAKEEG